MRHTDRAERSGTVEQTDAGAVAALAPPQPPRRRRLSRVVASVIPPFLVFAGVIGLWLVFTYWVLDANRRFLLPPPHDVAREGFLIWNALSEILAALWSTTLVTLVGLAIAIVLGMTLAMVMAQAQWIERAILPYAVVVQAVPIIAIVPLIVLWLGTSLTSRVVVTIIISIFPIITNTLFGLKSTDRNLHDLVTLHRANRRTRLVKVQFPSALPAIFTGLRIAAGLAVIGAIVGDLFFRKGDPGIGRLLAIYQDSLRTEELITAIVFSTVLGLVLFVFFGAVGSYFTSWHPSAVRNRYQPKSRPISATKWDRRVARQSGRRTGPGVVRRHVAAPTEEAATVDLKPTDEEAVARVDRPVARSGRARRRFLPVVAPPLGLAVLLAGAWYLFSYVVLEPRRRFLVPPPHELWTEGFGDPANLAQLVDGLWTTSKVAIIGLAIAIGIGVLFAILMSQAVWIERSFYPWAVFLQTVPILALVPLVGLWFGFGFTGRLIVCVLIALFPIITNTLFGLLSPEESLHDLLTLHGAGRMSRLRKLELRAALPAMFTGFRIAAGLSVIGAIVGEFFFQRGERGLGNLLDLYRGRLETPEMFAALLLSSALGIAMFWVFTWLGNALTKSWHESAAAQA